MIRHSCRSSLPVFAALAGLLFVIPGCSAAPTVTPTLISPPTVPPTHTSIPSVTSTFTAAPIPMPALTLKPGDLYFSVDGRQSMIFSRNIAGYQQSQYELFLDWTKAGGSKFVRVSLDTLGGMGLTGTGEVDPNWLTGWDRIFDLAEADGIYVLPVFSTWFDWNNGNPDMGYSTWKDNPVNQAKGGSVRSPAELFEKGSKTQTMWMNWMRTAVSHWHGRRNILAWEVFSEVNLASGPTETTGIDFVNTAAALIRSTDPGRPVTASIADCPPGSGACYWPNFYKQSNIDFVEMHPYPPQLDRVLITEVRKTLGKYDRPVLIGESGLSSATPDSEAGKLTVAKNAPLGVSHAIWASIVSGAMNGRSLWWEDGVGIYFPKLGIPWMQQYQAAELPAAKFVDGMDFSGFKPLATGTSSDIWGAAVGNEKTIIGWFRDAACEPPDWNLKPVLSGQTVTVAVPGSATDWHIDFYDTKTGTDIIRSSTITPNGNMATIPLPDFADDIAFKMFIQK
jgi:hypothetical protein